MATATMTIEGLYRYNAYLFDGLTVPEGLSKETAVFRILLKTNGLSVICPDPDRLQSMITAWSVSRETIWDELYATTQYDYNPIWNKDGTITETETGTNTKTETDNGGYADNLHTESETKDSSIPFENSGFKDLDKTTGERTDTNSGTRNNTNTANGGHTVTRTRSEHGNIGITTTQAMIKEQREVVQIDLYDLIATEFKQNFCVMVY